MGFMSVMGRQGDKKIKWNPETGEGVPEATAAFDAAKKRGMMMVEKVVNKETGEQEFQKLAAFNPKASEILAVPPMAGGAV